MLNMKSRNETKMSAKYGCVSTFQPAITCSKLTMETLEQYVKYVES